MTITIIGIDCATKDSNTGLCLAEASPERLRILEVVSGKSITPTDQVVKWIEGKESTILALDAPLGWPEPLASSLPQHQAGRPISALPDLLFKRRTDKFVDEVLGRTGPLEIGADRIARTAHAALKLLSTIGERIGSEIPLAWAHTNLPKLSAIEVYPAATLKARSVQSKKYKGSEPEKMEIRRSMLTQIQEELDIGIDQSVIVSDDNLFDAVVCALAGYDFVRGEALTPEDIKLARKEGWIWFRRPDNYARKFSSDTY